MCECKDTTNLVALDDLEKRLDLLRRNGVKIYEDGTFKVALDTTSQNVVNRGVPELLRELEQLRGR